MQKILNKLRVHQTELEMQNHKLRLMGISLDITHRKLIEKTLRANGNALHKLAGKLLTAQEEERRLLARELHDDLSQRLAVLAIEAGKLEKQAGHLPSQIVNKLRQIREQIVAISYDVHDISRQLHPSIIEDLGLVDALKSECLSFSRRENIPVRFEQLGVPDIIRRDIAFCLYRVSQEALRNIKKHAKAQKAEVMIIGDNEELVLRVKDHGVGFEPEKVGQKPGLGLASMEERARLIKGKFIVQSQIGKGTAIEIRVPLKE